MEVTRRKSPPLESWKTKDEAAAALGVSGKSVDRYVSRGLIERRTRRVPGRVPLSIFNPDDIEKIQKQTIPVMPAGESDPGATPGAQSLALRSRAYSGDLAGFLAELRVAVERVREPAPSNKMFLTLEEASSLTGLTQTWILRKIKGGDLPAFKDGGWKVRRADLEKL